MLDLEGVDKKLRNQIIGAIRRLWHRHPLRIQALQRVRSEEITYRKDGSPAARPAVFYTCELCGAKAKPQPTKNYPQIHIDHKDPVVPVYINLDMMTLSRFVKRLFCLPDGFDMRGYRGLDNLQAICSNCHQAKTNTERTARKKEKV